LNNWIREGRLSAFRTPGGHRRVRLSDLISFATDHGMPLPVVVRPTKTSRVMVVDDEPALLAATRRILERHISGLEVATHENAIAALLNVAAFRPDLIIFDIFMPGLDGLEACRRLKAEPSTSGIQLLITSGALTDELRRQAFELGALDCLTKPFRPEDLIEAIGAELKNRAV
jgi:CheY-like chemotaxis protein